MRSILPSLFTAGLYLVTNTEGGLFYIFDKCGGFGSTRYTICFDVYNFGESFNLHLKIYCQFIFNSCEVNVVKQNPMSPFKGGKFLMLDPGFTHLNTFNRSKCN